MRANTVALSLPISIAVLAAILMQTNIAFAVTSATGSIANITSTNYADPAGNFLVTSTAKLDSSIGLNSTWIETYNKTSNAWTKRIENTPNSGFNNVTCGYTSYLISGDSKFADKNGCTAVPWGFEVWGCYTDATGNVDCNYSKQAGGGNKQAVAALFDASTKYEGSYSAKITGLYPNATVVMAIPGYLDKPDIVAGETYRLEMMVKMQNVKGTGCQTVDNPPKPQWFCGFRIYQTFFNSSSSMPKYVYYGSKYNGTSDWFKVTFDAKAASPSGPDSSLLKGDPAIELAGQGTIWVDNLRFYSLNSSSPMSLRVPISTTLNDTSTLGTAIYYAPGHTATPVNRNYELMYNEGTHIDGTYVYMWPNSQITISKWNTYSGSPSISSVTAQIAYLRSYGGIATVSASVNGTTYPIKCSFSTVTMTPKVFSCDLKAAGIDTPAELNNLTLKVQVDNASNGSIDSIKVVVNQTAPANTWVPIKITWFAARAVPEWRIAFSDIAGNTFYSSN